MIGHAAEPLVLVSVAPEKFLVEKIAGEHLTVQVIVPSGASPHSFEPSMRQMVDVAQAKVWFRIGEGFETGLKTALAPHMEIIDLREGIDLLPLTCCHADRDAHDSHIWLSPALLITQAKTISQALQRHFPQFAQTFENRCAELVTELTALDQALKQQLNSSSKTCVLVSHGAFGYFCRDYGLRQITIEVEGKEPSARHVSSLIQLARAHNICHILVQPQYSQKGAQRIAHALNASIQVIDPYAENVIDTLHNLANLITAS